MPAVVLVWGLAIAYVHGGTRVNAPAIIDRLQGDFPICEQPYAEAAAALGFRAEVSVEAGLGELITTG